MKVWTVTSTDDLEGKPVCQMVAGSYMGREKALDACVDYVMKRMKLRRDLVWSMAHDENHPDAAKFFTKRKWDGVTEVRRGCHGWLRKFIKYELLLQDCYVVFDGASSWRFDIDGNDVEGEMFVTVTWGSSDCEDLAFTTPKPEMFVTEDTAIQTFVKYVKGLMADHGMEIPGDLRAVVKTQLHEDGKCQVDLDDGCSVSCVLYRDDMKTVKE